MLLTGLRVFDTLELVHSVIVAATDTATPSFNLLTPFKKGITEALVTVTQTTTPLVGYTFTFNQSVNGLRVQRWSPEAEIGLEWAAYAIADAVVPKQAVTLTITATAAYLTGKDANNLASAGSPLTSKTAGFHPTVVQSRIQTGAPSVIDNGKPVPDGTVSVNFNNQWGYEGVVRKITDATGEVTGQYDFESVMMHELMHAYGFLSTVASAGNNGGANENWSTFDKFITNSSGISAVDPTTYTWNNNFNANLTGGNGGLYFKGTNEAIAFGGQPVPLFTPEEWASGSSMSHLNDDYFNNKTNPSDPRYIQLMNARDTPGIAAPDYLSSVEIGILKDLGYTTATAASMTPTLL